MNRKDFPFQETGNLVARILERIYSEERFLPTGESVVAPAPELGSGIEGMETAWMQLLTESAILGSPQSAGHMDTAPHPIAAFTDTLVSALNNNLLFRELSPFASRVEEQVLTDLSQSLGLTSDWHGTFCSGGSIANMTALFAACGGYQGSIERSKVRLFVSSAAHNSIIKAAAVLGISSDALVRVPSDAVGRYHLTELADQLSQSTGSRNIVVGVFGSTVHGAIDNIAEIAAITKAAGAWLHVDAIYGAALGFSDVHRHLLSSMDLADSVVAGPQKWMYVPRLSAALWIKGRTQFEKTLGFSNNYSALDTDHRGQWGLQGSRRADAVTLWVLMQCLGKKRMGDMINQSIRLAQEFHAMIQRSNHLVASHQPELNLQCFKLSDANNYKERHRRLSVPTASGIADLTVPWVSLSQWENQPLFRSVLLSPQTTVDHLQCLIDRLS